MQCQNIVTVFSALLTPVLALLAGFIAYRQWRTARDRLKLDLFDRRLAIFEAVRSLIGEIQTSGRTSHEREFEYLRNTRGAIWLFDRNIVNYLDQTLFQKVTLLNALQAEVEGAPAGEERTRNIRRQSEIKAWLGEQHRTLETMFAPYLKLTH